MLVTRLGQLARSTRDLLNTLDAIAKAGAGCRSNGESWANTTTAHGRLMLAVLGGLSEFERELVRARTGEDHARPKAREFIRLKFSAAVATREIVGRLRLAPSRRASTARETLKRVESAGLPGLLRRWRWACPLSGSSHAERGVGLPDLTQAVRKLAYGLTDGLAQGELSRLASF
jgi:resolvase-like protein